jgi:DNA-binding Xre family transcriptional regulator
VLQDNISQKINDLLKEIEYLRKNLVEYEKNNRDKGINSQEILKISKALDCKINEYYRLTNK